MTRTTSDGTGRTRVTVTAGGRSVDTTLDDLRNVGVSREAAAQFGGGEPVGYVVSDEVEAVARDLMRDNPDQFRLAAQHELAYLLLYRKLPSDGGIHAIAKFRTCPEPWLTLGEYEGAVEVNATAWMHMGQRQRHAVVAHELCHASEDDNGRLTAAKHDVEEFGWVVGKYGAWHGGLERFAEQLTLTGDRAADLPGQTDAPDDGPRG